MRLLSVVDFRRVAGLAVVSLLGAGPVWAQRAPLTGDWNGDGVDTIGVFSRGVVTGGQVTGGTALPARRFRYQGATSGEVFPAGSGE